MKDISKNLKIKSYTPKKRKIFLNVKKNAVFPKK